VTDPRLDKELLTTVQGSAEEREPGEKARATAVELDVAGQPDLRGVRDRDPSAPHPWRLT
jgi:hypothetical protein